jgi:hypothetical protein
MAENEDWVKSTAIVLAIVFFFLWIYGTSINNKDLTTLQQKYDTLYLQCNSSISNSNTNLNDSIILLSTLCQSNLQSLHNQWEISFNNLLNCYEQGTAECKYMKPTLNLSNK